MMSVAMHVAADNLALQDVKRGEQGRGAAALIMVPARHFFICRPVGEVRHCKYRTLLLFDSLVASLCPCEIYQPGAAGKSGLSASVRLVG
jgi:hypothetical protein